MEGDRPVLVFCVDHLGTKIAELRQRGSMLGSRFEMPFGVGILVSSPGPQRLAFYERTQQERGEGLTGRKDF